MHTNTLQSGVYEWWEVQTYGPAVTYAVRLEAGRVTFFSTGEGEALQVTPAGRLPDVEDAVLKALHHALDRAARLAFLGYRPVTFVPEAQPIGKARACKLHRLMASAGVPASGHYALAAEALKVPVSSLAALSPAQACRVWRHLCATYPQARTLAA